MPLSSANYVNYVLLSNFVFQAVKFAEKVITTLSEKQRHSEIPKKMEAFSSLDQLPSNHAILRKNEMKILGETMLEQLLKFIASPAISRYTKFTFLFL